MKIQKTLLTLFLLFANSLGFSIDGDRYDELAKMLFKIRELDYYTRGVNKDPISVNDAKRPGILAAKKIVAKIPDYKDRISFWEKHIHEFNLYFCENIIANSRSLADDVSENPQCGGEHTSERRQFVGDGNNSNRREKMLKNTAGFLREKLPAENLESAISVLQKFLVKESNPEVDYGCSAVFDTLNYFLANLKYTEYFVAGALFPLRNFSKDPRLTGSQEIVLRTVDNHEIRATYVPPITKDKGVVILYHGNSFVGKTWENTSEYRFFRKLGLGVIMPTIRVYSDPTTNTMEFNKSLLFDTEAVVNFLVIEKKIPVNKILSFGFSLGGAYATTTAHYFRTPLILQNAWQNVPTIVSDNLPSYPCLDWSSIYENFENEDYFQCDTDLRLYKKYGYSFHQLTQDFGDNKRKLTLERNRKNRIDVMILYGIEDQLMGGYQGALKLFEARYDSKLPLQRRLIGLEGDHQVQFASSRIGKAQVFNFLFENNLLGNIDAH
ncbi:MAG: hypothetical protein AB8G05_24685 [Oligoflexales bacterium]